MEFIQKVINRFPKVDSTWLINGKTNVGTVPKIEAQDAENQKITESISIPIQDVEKKESNQLKAPQLLGLGKSIKKIVVFYNDGTFEELAN